MGVALHNADPVKSEIAAARDARAWLERSWPKSETYAADMAAVDARVSAAEEQDYETMVSTRAWHERLKAEYAAKGNQFSVEEHQAGIARCDAALAALVPAREDRRAA